jgi:hypothetical protein
MFIYLCVCLHYLSLFVSVFACVSAFMHVLVCAFSCIQLYCLCRQLYTCMSVYVCFCVSVRVCVVIFACAIVSAINTYSEP